MAVQTHHQDTRLFTQNEIRHFSLARAVRDIASERYRGTLETEMLSDVAERTGKPVSANGFVLPWQLLSRSAPSYSADMEILERNQNRYVRGLDATSTAPEIVPTAMLGAVDALRGFSLVADLGASVVAGKGTLSMPESISAADVHWLDSEYDPITESRPEFGTVGATPHIAGSVVTYSKLWQMQSLEGEAFLEQHLRRTIAAALDQAAISGSGINGQPTGLENTAGVQAQAIGGDLAAAIPAAMRKVEASGARCSGFALDPVLAESLRTTAKLTGAAPILERDQIDGKPALVSTATPASTAFAGSFDDMVVVLFGEGVQIAIDPFTGFEKGLVSMRALLSVDIAIRRAASFVKIS